MIEESKKKIEYIDIARGIAIILMIIGHVLTQGSVVCNLIYSFHMPLFIFTSGMFFKERDFKRFIANITKKLLLPYIIVVLIVDICEHKVFSEYFSEILQPSVTMIGVLWFLPCLAIIKFIFYIFKKISKENDILLYVLCFVSSMVGYYLKDFVTSNVIYDIALFALIYYCIGYFLMKYNVLNKILENKKVMLILLFIWMLGANVYRDLALKIYANGYITVVVAMCGSFVLLKLSKIIFERFCTLSKSLMWYGRNSFYIVVLHHVECELVHYDKVFDIDILLDRAQIAMIKIIITTAGVFIKDLIFAIYNKLRNKKRMYK